MSIPLSVVIMLKNEESRIEDCLKTVYGWAEEIIILDDESTDRTVEICLKYTDKIFRRKMTLEGVQRNFGASKTKFDWIMMLDCDERLTPELREEIGEAIKKNEGNVVAYWIPKDNFLGKHQLKYGGWSNPHFKLYDRRHVRWNEANYDIMHAGVIIEPGYNGRHLKNPYIHYNYANVEDCIRKDNRYSTLEAIKWYLDGRKMGLGKALWRTVDRFIRRFITKKGYKDGFYGFVAAFISSFHELTTYAKYCEIKENGFYIDRYRDEIQFNK